MTSGTLTWLILDYTKEQPPLELSKGISSIVNKFNDISDAFVILFQFYILRADEIGNQFKELLIRKAGEGVAVYVMFDGLGSSDMMQAWLDDFRQAGVKIAPFNTRKGNGNRFQINFRNHRKILVVDGRSTWVGGFFLFPSSSLGMH